MAANEKYFFSSCFGFLFVHNQVFRILFLSEKNLPDWESNRGPSDPQPSPYPLSYRAIDIINVKIDLYISTQTLDQYWSTLVKINISCSTCFCNIVKYCNRTSGGEQVISEQQICQSYTSPELSKGEVKYCMIWRRFQATAPGEAITWDCKSKKH